MDRDCNNCVFHEQGKHPPPKCQVCLVRSEYVAPEKRLPFFIPISPAAKEAPMEYPTIELDQLSPHTVVTNFVPRTLPCGCGLAKPCDTHARLQDEPAADPYKRVFGVDSTEPAKAKTYDDGKAPLARVPWAAIDAMAEVQAYGHAKYGDFDNYRKGMEVSRNLSCAIRHIRDYMNGADVDHESGKATLGHAMCRIAFVLQNVADGVAIDDRFTSRKG